MQIYPVALNGCAEYNIENIAKILEQQLELAGVTKEMLAGKKIVLKPNLVMNKKPDFAATTHPAVIAGTARALRNMGADALLLAESSGGPYTETTIRLHYNGCGIKEIAQQENITLNYKTGASTMQFPAGATCRSFHVIQPIYDADVIVNICKLKTHSLTKMSCGVKNLYGVIPGTEKVEMHARFSRIESFTQMLCDLAQMLLENKTMITICDGICGMEGNGPTGGTPREYGVLMTSLSPFSLDLLAEHLLGFNGTVPSVQASIQRGVCPVDIAQLTIVGTDYKKHITSNVIPPDTSRRSILRDFPDLFGGRLVRFLEPRPKIDQKKCVGCGVCAASCPKKTIIIKEKNGKKRLDVQDKNCIRCYCCQEMCPKNAVKIQKNFILRLVR
ncbi:MAG: DUF362 domain-containing protein [Clostridiales bacterium]|jgi:uncharacterized protein (DUF362 family)/NAD-dependent dihydropyrimidine dehydrogenase PreA subunit|nr:DUF362 domain-containing protein [Clostridiales bacterium]